ncbi:hypothetical protein T09_10602 [Trichinella sp. T9]|nr:hypothetical protein T09_10602 [Trichinella sp. T9]
MAAQVGVANETVKIQVTDSIELHDSVAIVQDEPSVHQRCVPRRTTNLNVARSLFDEQEADQHLRSLQMVSFHNSKQN